MRFGRHLSRMTQSGPEHRRIESVDGQGRSLFMVRSYARVLAGFRGHWPGLRTEVAGYAPQAFGDVLI
jgi:hypothetical protein